MTPVEVEVETLMKVYYRSEPGNACAASQLVSKGLIRSHSTGRYWVVTERGKVLVEAICALPLPVEACQWVMP